MPYLVFFVKSLSKHLTHLAIEEKTTFRDALRAEVNVVQHRYNVVDKRNRERRAVLLGLEAQLEAANSKVDEAYR